MYSLFLSRFFFLIITCSLSNFKVAAKSSKYISLDDGFNISITCKPYKNITVSLAHYFGEEFIIDKLGRLNENSMVIFTGKDNLKQGVYVIFFEGHQNYFDFLVNTDQHFSIIAEADYYDYPQIKKFINSPENDRLLKYKQFMSDKQLETISINQQKSRTDNNNILLTYNSKLKEIENEISLYKESIIKDFPQSLLTVILTAMKEPEIPIDLKVRKTATDSLSVKKYIKEHYWDGVNLWDGRLAYTQFFGFKFDKYFDEVLEKVEDIAIIEIDHILSTAVASDEMTQFILHRLLYGSINHRYKWGDEVFVHIFEKYVAPKTYNWLSDDERKKISEKAYFMMGNMVGTVAPNIELPAVKGEISSLHALRAKYTVLCFWDPTCNHCRETLPKLDSIFKSKWNVDGIKIFAVANESEGTKNDWINYVTDNNLQEWTNVYCASADERKRVESGQSGYSGLYDVWYYPSFFLLDENKRFVAKKLNYNQMTELIASLLKKK